MQTARGQPQHDVAFTDQLAVDQSLAIDDPNGKTSKVVVFVAVHVGHDRGLAPQQRHVAGDTTVTDALHDPFQSRGVIAAHRDVVQKEERFGSGAKQVIDAHRYQIDPNGIMAAGLLCDLQLGSHSVGTADQDRIDVVAFEQFAVEIELKQAGEPAIAGDHAGAERAMHQPRQTAHRLRIDVQIDAGVFVSCCHLESLFSAQKYFVAKGPYHDAQACDVIAV